MASRVQPQVKPVATVNGRPVASVAKLSRGHLVVAKHVATWVEAVASVAMLLVAVAILIVQIRQG